MRGGELPVDLPNCGCCYSFIPKRGGGLKKQLELDLSLHTFSPRDGRWAIRDTGVCCAVGTWHMARPVYGARNMLSCYRTRYSTDLQ